MTQDFLFNSWPYLALAIFAVGLLVHFAISALRVGPSNAGALRLFPCARLWQISLVLLALAHLGGLLFPEEILKWNLRPVRLYILEGAAVVVGITVLCAWIVAAWKYLATSGGTIIQQIADVVFLACFFLETISGLLTAVLYRWASSWAAYTVTPYVRSLMHGQPESALPAGLPFVVQLHLFPAFVMFAVFPFTATASRLAGTAMRSLRLSIEPVARWAASGRAILLQRYNPSIWLWPEEEE